MASKKHPTTAAAAGTAVALAHEIEVLEQRAEVTAGRLAAAERGLAASKTARRKALAADPDAEVTSFTDQIRSDQDEVEMLTDLVSDLDDQLADTQRRYAAAVDREARAASARRLRQVAKDVAEPAVRIDEAAAIIAQAAREIEAALANISVADSPGPRPFRDDGYGSISASEAAAAVVADALAAPLADAFRRIMPARGRGNPGHCAVLARILRPDGVHADFETYDGVEPAISGSDLVQRLVVDRFERRAAAIVEGRADPDLSQTWKEYDPIMRFFHGDEPAPRSSVSGAGGDPVHNHITDEFPDPPFQMA